MQSARMSVGELLAGAFGLAVMLALLGWPLLTWLG